MSVMSGEAIQREVNEIEKRAIFGQMFTEDGQRIYELLKTGFDSCVTRFHPEPWTIEEDETLYEGGFVSKDANGHTIAHFGPTAMKAIRDFADNQTA